jgi:hypothetical protein
MSNLTLECIFIPEQLCFPVQIAPTDMVRDIKIKALDLIQQKKSLAHLREMKLKEDDLEVWKVRKELSNALRSGDSTALTTRLFRQPTSTSDVQGRADFLFPFLQVSEHFDGELMPLVLVQLQKSEISGGIKRYHGK